jgi:hypothetical protein
VEVVKKRTFEILFGGNMEECRHCKARNLVKYEKTGWDNPKITGRS